MPPSPLPMAVPARRDPLASATLASIDRAPKLMWLTKSGMASRSGFADRVPSTTDVSTGSSSSSGSRASWAGLNTMSSSEA